MKLGAHHIGTTVLLSDGTEDTILGYEEISNEFYSETRWWDQDGKIVQGEPAADVLTEKEILVWELKFTGYSQMSGPYVRRRIRVSDPHLAALVHNSYNERVRDVRPDGVSSFVYCEKLAVIVRPSLSLVLNDEIARDILNSEEVFDSSWREPQPEPDPETPTM